MIGAYEDKRKQELQICLLSLIHGPLPEGGKSPNWQFDMQNSLAQCSKPLFEKTVSMVTSHELPWVYQSIGEKLNICSLQTNQPLVVLDLQSLQSLERYKNSSVSSST